MQKLLPHIKANSVVERIRTDSILNPLLWLCGITEPFAIPFAFLSEGYAKIAFFSLAVLPVFAAMVAYFMWMFRDPDRLQSEDYQIAQKRILHGTKEEDEFQTIDQSSDHNSKALSGSELNVPDDSPERLASFPPEISRNGGA